MLVTAFGLSMQTREQGCTFWCDSSTEKTNTMVAGLAGLGAATAMAISATHGFSATEECRAS